jgi:hypothetical protein
VDAPRGSDPHTPGHGAAPRRNFIQTRELPGLLRGAALGRAAALRRVLGARRGGRLGAALAALPLVLASPDAPAAAAALAAYFCLAALTAARRHQRGFGGYRSLRLLLWTVPAPLLLAALARALGSGSRLLPSLAVLVGWLLLERGLRGGLADPVDHSRGAAGAAPGGRISVGTGSPGRE